MYLFYAVFRQTSKYRQKVINSHHPPTCHHLLGQKTRMNLAQTPLDEAENEETMSKLTIGEGMRNRWFKNILKSEHGKKTPRDIP